MSLFTLDGKRWWKVMDTGALNAAPNFLAMAMNLKMKWDTLAKEHGLKVFE